MYALRERRVHVTQEDFEMAVAKVISCNYFQAVIFGKLFELLQVYPSNPSDRSIYDCSWIDHFVTECWHG